MGGPGIIGRIHPNKPTMRHRLPNMISMMSVSYTHLLSDMDDTDDTDSFFLRYDMPVCIAQL